MATPYLPATEEDLRAQLAGGLLVEGPHLDLKAALAPPGRKANRDLAVDLAAFAIDGGRIVVGVEEGRDGSPTTLSPVTLQGLRERIDQVSRSAIDEPLAVRCVEIPSTGREGQGYLVIVIPPSPAAPHMVDGKYWGRADTTNRIVTDAEVVRLHSLRRGREEGVLRLLEDEVARDPAPGALRQQAHMFAVAVPVTGPPDLLHRAVSSQGWEPWLRAGLSEGMAGFGQEDQWAPDFGATASHVSRRANGWAIHSSYIDAGREVQPDASEDLLLELEVGEDGSLRLFCARASAPHPRQPGERVLMEVVVRGLTRRVIEAARNVASVTGYIGSWDIGLAVTNLRRTSSRILQYKGYRGTPYSESDYRQGRRVTHEELLGNIDALVDAIAGRLFRGLGSVIGG